MSERLVVSGSDGGSEWKVYASRSGGRLCMRDATTGADNGSSSGCDYKLPLDETESGDGSTLRLADGPVTGAATKVVLYGSKGETWTAPPKGANAGFGYAFYGVAIGIHAIITDVKAFDARGNVVGEHKPDQTAERYMASPPPG